MQTSAINDPGRLSVCQVVSLCKYCDWSEVWLRCSLLVVARSVFYDWLRQSLGEAAGLYSESVSHSVGESV